MADFESSLSKAASMEDCWVQIREGSQGFGFHEVRMSLGGASLKSPSWPREAALAIENPAVRLRNM